MGYSANFHRSILWGQLESNQRPRPYHGGVAEGVGAKLVARCEDTGGVRLFNESGRVE